MTFSNFSTPNIIFEKLRLGDQKRCLSVDVFLNLFGLVWTDPDIINQLSIKLIVS